MKKLIIMASVVALSLVAAVVLANKANSKIERSVQEYMNKNFENLKFNEVACSVVLSNSCEIQNAKFDLEGKNYITKKVKIEGVRGFIEELLMYKNIFEDNSTIDMNIGNIEYALVVDDVRNSDTNESIARTLFVEDTDNVMQKNLDLLAKNPLYIKIETKSNYKTKKSKTAVMYDVKIDNFPMALKGGFSVTYEDDLSKLYRDIKTNALKIIEHVEKLKINQIEFDMKHQDSMVLGFFYNFYAKEFGDIKDEAKWAEINKGIFEVQNVTKMLSKEEFFKHAKNAVKDNNGIFVRVLDEEVNRFGLSKTQVLEFAQNIFNEKGDVNIKINNKNNISVIKGLEYMDTNKTKLQRSLAIKINDK